MEGDKLKLVSLFSCGGLGDYGFAKSGFEPVLLSDINPERLKFAQRIFPQASVVEGDINIIADELTCIIKELVGDEDFLLSMTPPCQGMSLNGIRTIHKAIADGKRPAVDERNYLLVSALNIIAETKPAVVFFENVPQVKSTYILINDKEILVTDYLHSRLKELGYTGNTEIVNFKYHGIPQSRTRLIGLFTKDATNYPSELPPKAQGLVNMAQALSGLPKLDAKNKQSAQAIDFHPLHKVPVMRAALYEWVRQTPEGHSAFENNTCPSCLHRNNLPHIICSECGVTLPKPHVIKDGGPRLIKGYDSTYKRQYWSKPSNTVTTRSAFASSSSNLHPTENRVMSAYECAILQGLEPSEIEWINPDTSKVYPDYLVRELIGEAVPPAFTYKVGRQLLDPPVINITPSQQALVFT